MTHPSRTAPHCPQAFVPAQFDRAAETEEAMLRTVYLLRDSLMRRHAFPEARATEIAQLLVDTLRDVSDDDILLTRSAARRRAVEERNAAIRRDIRPGNAHELARQWRISVTHVYRIAGQRAA